MMILLLCLSWEGLRAQQPDKVDFEVYLRLGAGMNLYLSNGATVTLMTARDTLYAVSAGGTCRFPGVRPGKATVYVSHLNFEPVLREVDISGKNNWVSVSLKMKTYSIDALKVTGKVPLITTVGDTIRFNAAAVKLLEGDVALEILRQVPGVEISDAGITVLGQNVARTYVNKTLVFGTGQMTALTTLPAAEVVSIDTYEEPERPWARGTRRAGENVRVLNIRTKEPIVNAVNSNVLASYGHDFDPRGRDRYGAGGMVSFFSEKLRFDLNGMYNNIGRTSNQITNMAATGFTGSTPSAAMRGYAELGYFDAAVERSWGVVLQDPVATSLKAYYNYRDDKTLSRNIVKREYFPTDRYASREYADSSEVRNKQNNHAAGVSFALRREKMMLTYGSTFAASRSRYAADRLALNSLDGDEVFTMQETARDGNTLKFGHVLTYWHFLGEKGYDFWINAQYNHGRGDGSGVRVTGAPSGMTKTVESGPVGDNSDLNLDVGVQIPLFQTPRITISPKYGYRQTNSTRRRISTDLTDLLAPATDSINSYDYTERNRTHTGSLFIPLPTGKNNSLWLTLAFQSSAPDRTERFPDPAAFGQRQNAWLPSVKFQKRPGGSKSKLNIRADYSTSTTLPSMEEWRAALDTRDPYQMVAGNPDLRQSYSHNLSGSINWYSRKKATRSYSFSGELNVVRDAIVDKTFYFAQETPLPAWDVVAPAQSTLTTFENRNGNLSANLRFQYGFRWEKAKLNISVSPSANYLARPYYIGEQLNRTKSYAPRLGLSVSTNFSTKVRITLSSSGSYIYSANTAKQDDKVLNFSGGASAECRGIFKRLFLKTYYYGSYYRSLSDDFPATSTHVLNVVAGSTVLKKMEVSFAAYDILNRNTGFSTSMQSDYVRSVWTQSFGRYYTFNVGFKIFKSRSGLKATSTDPMQLREGVMRELR